MDQITMLLRLMRNEFGNPLNTARIKVVTVLSVDYLTLLATVEFARGDVADDDPPVQAVSWLKSYAPRAGDLAYLMLTEGSPILIGLMEGESWINLTLPAGWSTVVGNSVPGYRMNNDGRVIFRGGANIPANDPVGVKFTMPIGYRPPDGQRVWALPYSNGTAITGHLRYNCGTSGNIASALISPAATVFATFENLSYDIRT